MIILRKRSKEMCIGHRLIDYPGRCKNLHGHAIVIELEISVPLVNEVGMGVDFDEIGKFFGWIDEIWDHGFLVHPADLMMIDFLRAQGSNHWICPLGNPTMENLASWV